MKISTAFLFSYAVNAIIDGESKQASASISSTSSSVSSSSVTALSSTSTSNHAIQCAPLSEDDYAPTLDGIADEWTNVTVYELPLISASTSQPYSYGNGAVQMQCVYDDEKIYFVFYVPGKYRGGDSDEDGEEDGVEMHAAISTMFKIGDEASLSNMGDCPNANDCTTALEACEAYKVDWQLLTSKMSDDGGTTIDDKYSVTLGCRYDDDHDGGNEWEGAWTHSNTTLLAEERSSSSSNSEESSSASSSSSENNSTNLITMAEVRNHNTEDDLWMVLENKVFDLTDFVSIHPGGPGYLIMNAGMDGTDPFQDVHFGIFSRAEVMEYYIGDLDMSSKFEWVFEMSRPLKTDSTKTDAQFMEGKSVDFGFSFWDPHESENGWTNSGYYTTGSTKTWMSLQIGQQIIEDTKIEVTSTSTSTMTSTVASSSSRMDVLSIGCTFILTMCAAWRIV